MRTSQLKQTTENNGGPLVRQKATPGVLTKHQHVTSWEWERVAQIQDKAYMPLYDFSNQNIIFLSLWHTPSSHNPNSCYWLPGGMQIHTLTGR